VPRRICGPKREKVVGGYRKLHNEKLLTLYSSPDIIRVMKASRLSWVGHATLRGKTSNAYRILVGKPEN